MPNYTRLRDDLAAAGRPTAEGLRALVRAGVRTVVDLRRPEEPGVEEEKALLAELGVAYVPVPVTPATFSGEDVSAVAKVLADPARGPVLLHCSSSNRVGGVWAVLRAREGRSREDAIADGKAAGLASEGMIAAASRVIDAGGR